MDRLRSGIRAKAKKTSIDYSDYSLEHMKKKPWREAMDQLYIDESVAIAYKRRWTHRCNFRHHLPMIKRGNYFFTQRKMTLSK